MEEWRYIKGYNNKYQVSNLGRVRTVDRIDSFINSKGTLIKRFKKGKILKSRVFSIYPYPVVYLNHHPKSVHRLVAEAFIPNPDKKPCVNHIDANPKNNNLFNLEWCTYSKNQTLLVSTPSFLLPKDSIIQPTCQHKSFEIRSSLSQQGSCLA